MSKKTILILLSVIVGFAWSCEDEVENIIEQQGETVFDTLSTRPNARILTYQVENAPSDIFSAINDETGEIKVYLPHYYTIGFIDPIITLPESATISPDADELVPVFSDEPFVYTVSAPDEPDTEYTVFPIVQQPEIVLKELSSENDTARFTVADFLEVNGQNFITTIAEAYLIDEEGTEWQLTVRLNDIESTSLDLLPLDLTYEEDVLLEIVDQPLWFEVRVYALEKRMKYPVIITES
ncbi:MAG: hypothetical protein AAGA02_01090 [Bacteroidota bacterium]